MTTLGKALRNARKTRHFTLADVKEETGISVSFLSDVERGVTNPSIETLEKLALCYQVPISELLKDVDSGLEPEERYYPPGFNEFEKSLRQSGVELTPDMRELLLQVEHRAKRKTTTKDDWFRRYYLLKNEIE